ncbi:putative HTH-type transcriptional regulator YttP [Ruminiclostridium hungatei]|uniref:Putative HTH-type transcriptional regulator YttP n=1 Tax=Ruminiclostridium hungatei TaxID=48256 RepID=A0A1V4SKT6_RUMHU|nr:TetR/AcrR family transcriptional regulator [Ruminiclostridium hungatei]OPX44403.1 putative HTH-type transcriptional regulator YttP [Ruminiclostridium hungatei]
MPYLKEEVKEKILASAVIKFREQGYSGASMRQIASSAGVSLGNVYRYFENKDALFNAIVGPVYESYIAFIHHIDNLIADEENNMEAGAAAASDIAEISKIQEKLLEICEEHYTELLIIMDKSAGTRYENAKQALILLLDKILKKKFLPYMKNKDSQALKEDVTYIFSSSFIESICIILRKYEAGSQIRLLIDRFITLFFDGLEKRL